MSDETPEAAYRLLHERQTGAPARPGDRSLSAAQYDAARAAHLAERHVVVKPGASVWPPTSQTLMKRLGGGSWARAMESLGLQPNSGRAKGVGAFSDDDYRGALTEFLAAAADVDQADVASDSFTAYTDWAKRRGAAQARVPSGAAVRQHFGSWAAAKAAVSIR